jgi:hypothetical protein
MKSNTFLNTKHHLAAILLLTLIAVLALPQQAAALSCLNPAEMIERYANQDSYTVAIVTAGAVETMGDTHDQSITTKTLYKGELDTIDTVTFSFDETWNYLCTGGPATEGTEAVYVLSDKQVAHVFALDSQLAQTLLGTIDTPEIQPTPVTLEEAENKNLMEQIIALLGQIITLLTPQSDTFIPAPVTTNNEPAGYIGMNPLAAAVRAEAYGVLFRVVEIDGVPQTITEDLREGRINASLENGVIIEYSIETISPAN